MKKIANTTIIFISLILLFNCTDNDSLEIEKNEVSIEKNDTFIYDQTDYKFDFSKIDFSNISFDFSENDAIIIEHKNDKIRKSLFIDNLFELFEQTEKSEFSEKDYLGLNFSVSFLDNKYTIFPEKFVFETKNLSRMSSACPSGMSKHKTCRSAQCVKDTLATYGAVMESGDSFSVHYGTFGVRICASSGLIKKANAYIAPAD